MYDTQQPFGLVILVQGRAVDIEGRDATRPVLRPGRRSSMPQTGRRDAQVRISNKGVVP